ncbi:MAG: BamA/TamA family outer membrane protein [Alistipes sp.]|nr:BamA/TamA family outer membrane protein [Alistipes sp.]
MLRFSLPIRHTTLSLRALLLIAGSLCWILGSSGCSATKHLSDNQYLLSRVKIQTPENPDLEKKERIPATDLGPFVRQYPTHRFLGTNFYIWVYNSVDTTKNNGWNRFKRRLGKAPILLDSALTTHSASGMRIYLQGKGFLNATTTFKVDTAKRKARVTYIATPGTPYRVDSIAYAFRDSSLRAIILSDSSHTLLRRGMIFDATQLDKERSRIASFLKNRGYYNFSINNLSYIADTTIAPYQVALTLVVKPRIASYSDQGEARMDQNRIYRLRNIYILPNYNPSSAISDSLYLSRLDTLYYKGLSVVYDTRIHVRPEILRRTIALYPNYLYNEQEVKRTYDNLMRLGYYKSASVLFSEVADSTDSVPEAITYIGSASDSLQAHSSSGTEHYLDCNILCIPGLRQSYSLELEGTTSSDYFGITATVGYQNRNIFRGVEQLDLKVRGGYEFMRIKGKRNSYELGFTAGLSFPRLLTPWHSNRYNRAVNPRTKLEFNYNVQRRPYYHRNLGSGVWGYSWSNKRNSSFVLRPIDISIVNMKDVNEDFLNELENPYLEHSYESQLIAGLSGSYIYNNHRGLGGDGTFTLRTNFEFNGNLIDGLSRLFNAPVSFSVWDNTYYRELFGIRYAQYLRIDVNLTKKFLLGPKTSLVYRFYGGWGYAYGNASSIPFERLFYCGGSNSMRGWLARTLGPGNERLPVGMIYPSQLGNFKLETNLEARFPVWGILHGAVFFDVGNIWFMNQGAYDYEGLFRIDRFYKQLGFNTGLGVRFDFNFFVFRVDWGIKLHDPNQVVGERWIHNFRIKNTTLNFGVGYPF